MYVKLNNDKKKDADIWGRGKPRILSDTYIPPSLNANLGCACNKQELSGLTSAIFNGQYCDPSEGSEMEYANCEVWYWVNKNAGGVKSSCFPLAACEQYSGDFTAQILAAYYEAAKAGTIPEYSYTSDKTVIDYLLTKTQESEGRVRAIMAEFVKSVQADGKSRKRILPCLLYPKSNPCKSIDPYQQKQQQESTMQQVTNILQTVVILAIVVAGGYVLIKFGGAIKSK
jgi:hypothetical protein